MSAFWQKTVRLTHLPGIPHSTQRFGDILNTTAFTAAQCNPASMGVSPGHTKYTANASRTPRALMSLLSPLGGKNPRIPSKTHISL